jgi:hypothetical protein
VQNRFPRVTRVIHEYYWGKGSCSAHNSQMPSTRMREVSMKVMTGQVYANRREKATA